MIRKKLNKNKNRIFIFSILAIFLCCAQGCDLLKSQESSESAPDTATPVNSTDAPVMEQISSSTAIPEQQQNHFDFSSKKDPFKPYIVAVNIPAGTSRKNTNISDLPIHSYEISQFRLLGVLLGGNGDRAMVADPQGRGYVLRTGMTIGKNNGRVASITSGGVDVLEQYRDDSGKIRKERISIKLPRKQ